MMKFKKKLLQLDSDSEDNAEMADTNSFELYFKITIKIFKSGTDGVKFFKDSIQIGRHGITNLATGEIFGKISKDELEFHEVIGRGAAGVVQRAVYKPKGIQLALKVFF